MLNKSEFFSFRLLASATAMGLCTVLPGTVLAADPLATSQSPVADANDELETVYVIAQRRRERAQDVPITITTLDADQLESAGVQSLDDVATVTPALRFDSAGSFAQATIRGVGSAVVTSGAGTNVGIYVDGFYSPSPLAAEFELLNIENIQVLKGPQGTLFGHNTTGGAILVTTSKPSVNTRGVAAVSYGNYNSQRYEGYFTTGAENVAFDIAASYKKGDGYFHDIVTGSDKDGAYENSTVRAGLKIDADDGTWLLLRYEHTSTDDPTSYLNNAYVKDGVPQTPGAAFNSLGANFAYATKPHELAYASDTQFRQETDTFQLTASFDLSFANLTSYTQHSELNAQSRNFNIAFTSAFVAPGVYAPLGRLSLPNKGSTTFTQELLLNSKDDGRFKWTAGLFYLQWKDPFGADLSLGGADYTPSGRSSTTTVSAAAYVDGTYEVVDNLFLTAGLRYTRDETKDANFHDVPGYPVQNVDLPDLTSNKVTPRAVVRYALNPASSVYASYSRGHKSAIYNVGGAQTTPIAPESISAFEVGYKYSARGLSADLSSYYYDYKNLQVASYTLINNVPQSVVNNAASSRIYGIEGQLRYDITSDLNINIGAAYTDAKYESFIGSPTLVQCLDPDPASPLPECALPAPLPPPPNPRYGIFASDSTNLKDSPMQRAPKVTANAGTTYTTGLASGKLALSGNVYYTSKFYFDSSAVYYQKAYTLVGLRAEWTSPSDTFSFALYGDNVTDTEYRTVLQNTNFGIGNVWGPPAMYGGQVKVRF